METGAAWGNKHATCAKYKAGRGSTSRGSRLPELFRKIVTKYPSPSAISIVGSVPVVLGEGNRIGDLVGTGIDLHGDAQLP